MVAAACPSPSAVGYAVVPGALCGPMVQPGASLTCTADGSGSLDGIVAGLDAAPFDGEIGGSEILVVAGLSAGYSFSATVTFTNTGAAARVIAFPAAFSGTYSMICY